MARVSAVVMMPLLAAALDNGVGRTPQMGWSSWNAIGSTVNAAYLRNVTVYLQQHGFKEMGYEYVNVDEGWMLGRDNVTLAPVTDAKAFPPGPGGVSGMKALGDFIHSQGFKYGMYTSRGTKQCARPEYVKRCLHTPPNPPQSCEGSQGYEKEDGLWMIAQGADYIKEDSCGGSSDHATAFADYGRMRDALNASGKPVFFSLCGWHPWYAQPDSGLNYTGGGSLGNSFRISGDGRNWGFLTGAVNTMAAISNFTGPGGWSDPDLLIGPTCSIEGSPCGQTDLQARTQFSLWGLFPAPLMISQDVLSWSKYAEETYTNTAVTSINQDRLGKAAIRIKGANLTFPCAAAPADSDVCTNVWGRELSGARLAFVFVNNGPTATNITCGPACFGQLPMPADAYQIQDAWNVMPILPNIQRDSKTGGFSYTAEVDGGGGSRMFELMVATTTVLS